MQSMIARRQNAYLLAKGQTKKVSPKKSSQRSRSISFVKHMKHLQSRHGSKSKSSGGRRRHKTMKRRR